VIIQYDTASARPLVGEPGAVLPVDPVHPALMRRLLATDPDHAVVTVYRTLEGDWIYVEVPGEAESDSDWGFLVRGDPRHYAQVIFPRPDEAEGGFEWDSQMDATNAEPLPIAEIVAWAWAALVDHAQEVGEATP